MIKREKNKSLLIDKMYDYFQTVFTFLFGYAVAIADDVVRVATVVSAPAAVAVV